MTEAERQRLQEAEKRLQPQNKKVGIKKNSPYRITNARLKKVRKSKRLDPDRFQIRSKLLENYFIINRNELEVGVGHISRSVKMQHLNSYHYSHHSFYDHIFPRLQFAYKILGEG